MIKKFHFRLFHFCRGFFRQQFLISDGVVPHALFLSPFHYLSQIVQCICLKFCFSNFSMSQFLRRKFMMMSLQSFNFGFAGHLTKVFDCQLISRCVSERSRALQSGTLSRAEQPVMTGDPAGTKAHTQTRHPGNAPKTGQWVRTATSAPRRPQESSKSAKNRSMDAKTDQGKPVTTGTPNTRRQAGQNGWSNRRQEAVD